VALVPRSRTVSVRGFALDRLQSFGHIRAIDEEAKRATVVVSTGDVARDGMIIETAGWRFDAYDRNPVVLWGHDDSQMPVARAKAAERIVTSNELIETHEFDAEDSRAMELFSKIVRGFVNATSVRWNPLRWEFRKIAGEEVLVFTDQELLESSYVAIPADPGALVVRAGGKEPIDPNQFRPEPSHAEVKRAVQEQELARLADALEGIINPIKAGAK